MISNEVFSLKPNKRFFVNDHLRSSSSKKLGYTYWFTLQEDGNLVLRKAIIGNPISVGKELLWSSNTKSENPYALVVDEHSGNLFLYAKGNEVIWKTDLPKFKPRSLDLQSDGNLVLYDISNAPKWATNTSET